MGFKIDLGLNEKKERDATIDVVAAAEAMAAAEMGLVKCETEQAIVVAAAENLERGIELSKAIAEKTQDEGVALAVGNEALVASMRMLGQATAGEALTAGTESFTAGVEASEGMLKKILDKAKEYAKKAWDFILDLVYKITNFAKGIFGKGDTTGQQIDRLLKKAKESKETKLNVAKFEDKKAKKLITNVKYLAKKQANKGIDAKAIEEELDNESVIIKSLGDLQGACTEFNFNFGMPVVIDPKTVTDESKMSELVTFVNNLLSNDKTKLLDTTAAKTFARGIDDEDKTDISEELDGISRAAVAPLFSDGDVLKALVITSTATNDEIAKLSTDITGKEALEAIKKVVDSIRVKTVTVAPEDEEVIKFAADMKPVELADNEKIVKALSVVEKDIEKLNKQLDGKALKVSKEFQKELDDMGKAKDLTEIQTLVLTIDKNMLSVLSSIAQSVVKELANNVKMGVRSKFADILKESAKLYEK